MGNRSRYRPARRNRWGDGPRLGWSEGGDPEPGENFSPFGDVPFYGAPMPSEMRNGWRWHGERLRMINPRGAVRYFAIALAAVVLVILVGGVLHR